MPRVEPDDQQEQMQSMDQNQDQTERPTRIGGFPVYSADDLRGALERGESINSERLAATLVEMMGGTTDDDDDTDDADDPDTMDDLDDMSDADLDDRAPGDDDRDQLVTTLDEAGVQPVDEVATEGPIPPQQQNEIVIPPKRRRRTLTGE